MQRSLAVTSLVLLAGCGASGLTDPGAEHVVEWQGIQFDLVVRPAAPPGRFQRVVLRLRNQSGDRIARDFQSACGLWPRVYRTDDLSKSAWNTEEFTPNLACTAGPTIELWPGESYEVHSWSYGLDPDAILGDSLPEGDYVPGALFRPQATTNPQLVLIARESASIRR
ncbi:MAG: hypothetical protein MJB57_12660 [Gemmatimonadetes bacterium]|nr:hypothetical protein [Gemmatimonadota bacterium]